MIDLLLPNEDEILKITKKHTPEQDLDALALRAPFIVVECGSRGAVVKRGDHRGWVGPLNVDQVDTIGAGDSFNTVFLSFYLKVKTCCA